MHLFKMFSNSASIMSDGAEYFLSIMDSMVEFIIKTTFYESLLDFFTSFGILFCIIFFAVELTDKATSVSFTLDSIIHMFMKFIIAFALVTNIENFMLGMNEFVAAMNTEICDSLGSLDYMKDMWEKASEAGIFAGALRIGTGTLVTFMQVYYLILFGMATQYFIVGVAVARAIAIGVKSVIAPIVVPDIFVNGLNSSGVKFLKGLFGDFLQSTVILFLIEICCIISVNICGVSSDVSSHGFESALVGGAADSLAGFICVFILISTMKNSKAYATNLLYGFLN